MNKFGDRIKLYRGDSGVNSATRLIDWQRGAPYTFRACDYNELINSGAMFARKFDINIDAEICQKIFFSPF